MADSPIYRVKPLFRKQYPNAVTIVGGVGVVLADDDLIVDAPGTLTHPPKSCMYRAVTQDDLRYLFEVERHPAIEIVESERKKTAKEK